MNITESPTRQVLCPTCGKQIDWTKDNPWRPFCSERCCIIDLGDWASEKHKISDDTPADFINSDSDDDSYSR